MKHVFYAFLLTALIFGCSPASQAAPAAKADLKNPQGEVVGKAEFHQDEEHIHISVEAKGLTPGLHAIHIHGVGKCEGPEFTSAGPHYNPENKQHGLQNPQGAHAGDLPNLEADAEGNVKTKLMTHSISLDPNAPNTVFSKDGTSVVIHAGPDDDKTDPSGNSGGRVLCGVIEKA